MGLLDHPFCQGFKKMAGTSGGEWAGPCPQCGGKDKLGPRLIIPPHNRCLPESSVIAALVH